MLLRGITFNFDFKKDNIKIDIKGRGHVFGTKVIWRRTCNDGGLL
jgi:hypothetical protein